LKTHALFQNGHLDDESIFIHKRTINTGVNVHHFALIFLVPLLLACNAKTWGILNEASIVSPSNNTASIITSLISGTTGIVANNVQTSTITITLLDENSLPVTGVVPTFSAGGTGNSYTACSQTNASGVSTCTMKSTVSETKVLSITSPINLDGASVTFITQTASAANSSLSVTEYVFANNSDLGTITVILKDSDNVAIPGRTPALTSTGTNTINACSATDSNGETTCTIKSAEFGTKTISFVSPSLVGLTDTINFVSAPFTLTIRTSYTNPPLAQDKNHEDKSHWRQYL
jgi:hypothetical protein